MNRIGVLTFVALCIAAAIEIYIAIKDQGPVARFNTALLLLILGLVLLPWLMPRREDRP